MILNESLQHIILEYDNDNGTYGTKTLAFGHYLIEKRKLN
jgi:hypothetical protein